MIGEGASSFVYRGSLKGRIVAVKELKHLIAANPRIRKLLVREITTCIGFKHPNICQVFGGWDTYDEEEGIYPSMVMEFVPLTLLMVLSNPAKYGLTQEKKKAIIHQLAMCLMSLHSRLPSVYHCDLKPENIMLTEDLTVKLIDFGIAKVELQTLAGTINGQSTLGGPRGTPGFMVCFLVLVDESIIL
jgi:serine/threonine-protein kinase